MQAGLEVFPGQQRVVGEGWGMEEGLHFQGGHSNECSSAVATAEVLPQTLHNYVAKQTHIRTHAFDHTHGNIVSHTATHQGRLALQAPRAPWAMSAPRQPSSLPPTCGAEQR